jgi:hypothetical protein
MVAWLSPAEHWDEEDRSTGEGRCTIAAARWTVEA